MPFQKGNKLGGRRSTRNSNIIRSPTPPPRDDASDEEMADAGDGEDLRDGTPGEEPGEAGTPAQDDDDEAETPPTITAMPRRRGRGRGGSRHNTRHDRDTPEGGDNEGSEAGTPFRRKRGRPSGWGRGEGRSRGGFRGRRKGVQPEVPRVMDRDGNTLDVVDDSAVVDDDSEGNEKVDEDGRLQGGREYRVRTFTIIGKGDRLYMLSTEPARCCGFRDSYLFFTKHPKLFKVLLDEEQKKDLIDRDILPSSYKGRNIGVVTARSVFREFGARIIVAGRKVVDDYKVAEARANGEIEGELADPEDRVPADKTDYNRNRYVAWFGASDVYRTNAQPAPGQAGKPGPVGKRRNNVTLQNWQFVHAREASRFNSAATALRQANLDGVYDTHTNMMFYPKIMQPTHARWEQIRPPTDAATNNDQKLLTNGLPNGDHKQLPNGTTDHELQAQAQIQPTIFHSIPSIISRNYTVIDTVFNAPPISHAGYPGPDGDVEDLVSGPNGLSSISEDLVEELPVECRLAFEEARRKEREWKRAWGREGEKGKGGALRGGLVIGLNGYPV